MHMQMSLLGSWVNAAVIMSNNQEHHAFLHLFMNEGVFILEVTVLNKDMEGSVGERDSLISELAYTITRLDRDMWEDTPVRHEVVVSVPTQENPENEIVRRVLYFFHLF